MKNTIQLIKIFGIAGVLSIGLSYAYAWTAPSAPPPTGNVSAPINTSGSDQTKTGIFRVVDLVVNKITFSDNTSMTTAGSGGSSVYWDFISSPQPITGQVSVAHGLGVTPARYEVVIKNTTAELGYSVGDEVKVASMFDSGAGWYPVSVWADSVKIGISYRADLGRIVVASKATNGYGLITNANWKLIFRAGGPSIAIGGGGGAFGPGYAWQDMAGSSVGCASVRASGVICTNSTGNPIEVMFSNTNTGATINIIVNGVTLQNYTLSAGAAPTWTFLVPSGASYKITWTGTLMGWKELRCDSGLNCSSGPNVPGSIGVGQTWQDMTASRASGVSYTNSTGKPIEISVTASASTGPLSLYLYVDGVKRWGMYSGNYIGNQAATIIVPSGSTYSATVSPTLLSWHELR